MTNKRAGGKVEETNVAGEQKAQSWTQSQTLSCQDRKIIKVSYDKIECSVFEEAGSSKLMHDTISMARNFLLTDYWNKEEDHNIPESEPKFFWEALYARKTQRPSYFPSLIS